MHPQPRLKDIAPGLHNYCGVRSTPYSTVHIFILVLNVCTVQYTRRIQRSTSTSVVLPVPRAAASLCSTMNGYRKCRNIEQVPSCVMLKPLDLTISYLPNRWTVDCGLWSVPLQECNMSTSRGLSLFHVFGYSMGTTSVRLSESTHHVIPHPSPSSLCLSYP